MSKEIIKYKITDRILNIYLMVPDHNDRSNEGTENSEEEPKLTNKVRRVQKRSKYGCPNCKKRRIKCDETIPICKNCTPITKFRCGYLDYSKAQLEMIHLSHLAAKRREERAKMPIVEQIFDPSKEIEVIQGRPLTTRKPTASPRNITTGIMIPLVIHNQGFPDPDKIPYYFNESRDAHLIRCNTLRVMHGQVLHGFKTYLGFNAILSVPTGILLARVPSLEELYLKIRGDCLNLLLTNLPKLNDNNAGDLWRLSMGLYSSSIYLENDDSFKAHFNLTVGPSLILQKLYEKPSKFPKSFEKIKFYGDSLLNTTRSLWIPQYDYRILIEFKEVIEEFSKKFIDDYHNEKIKQQKLDMIKILDKSIDVFENHGSKDLIIGYPLEKLYEIYQLWFINYPCECAILDNSQMNGIEKVFYVLWLTLLKELEAIILRSSYIFTFFIYGFVNFTQPFSNEDMINFLKKENNDELIWYFNYCARIMSFLDRRMVYVLSNPILSNPLGKYLHLKDDLIKTRPLEIKENCIIKFKTTLIKKSNYPQESKSIRNFRNNLDELLNYYKTTEAVNIDDLNNSFKKLDHDDEDDTNKVDILNNIDPKTSLLKNDYDPRFIEKEVFDSPLPIPNADLKFVQSYVLDRKLLLKVAIEGITNKSNT